MKILGYLILLACGVIGLSLLQPYCHNAVEKCLVVLSLVAMVSGVAGLAHWAIFILDDQVQEG